jgi:hypothetical protein
VFREERPFLVLLLVGMALAIAVGLLAGRAL